MKRSLKNILMILLIVLVGCSMAYTVSYAKDHITSNEIPNMNTEERPEMPSDNNSNMETPPDKPDNDNQENNENMTPPNDGEKPSNGANMGTPPAKPEGEDNKPSDNMPTNNTTSIS